MQRFLLFLLISLFSTSGIAQSFNWTGSLPIFDNQTDTVVISVSGLPSVIDSNFGITHVCVDISHTYCNDVVVKLFNAHGDSITLIQGIGGANDNFWNTCMGMDGTDFNNSIAPYSGIFVPVQDLNELNDGHDPNGDWLLVVSDVANADTGSVHSVTLEFTANPPQGGGSSNPVYTCATCACPNNASSCDLLPDMTSSAKEIELSVVETPGFLQISNATPNIGSGPLEIFAIDSCFCDSTPVSCATTTCPPGQHLRKALKQRIYQKVAGTDTLNYYDHLSGMMTFHPTHGHLHVDDFVSYTLRTPTSNPDATTWPIVGTGTKQSFCLINIGSCTGNIGECRDGNGDTVTTVLNHGLGFQTGCGNNQGIYAGYYDVYGVSLNEPIPLNNVCNGNYYIVSITDPLNHFIESDETNNWVAVPITLTQQSTLPVISASGPLQFCQGDSVILSCNTASSYLWSTGDTTQSIVVKTAGTFFVSINCGSSSTNSQSLTTQIISPTTNPTISIAITSGTNPACGSTPITFTATSSNAGVSPTYQWKINGSNVGTNSPTFTTSFSLSNQVVTCELTSSSLCLINPVANSNSITITLTSCYCTPIYGTTNNSGCLDGDLIWRFKVNTLDNITGASCPSGIAGYTDFTTSSNPLHSTTLQAGSAYPVTVTSGQYGEGYRVWIDYNNDGVFSSAEAIGNTGIVAGSGQVGVMGSTSSFTATIPCNAPVGMHRMRVRCAYNVSGAGMDPCTFINNFGEAEDYMISVVAPASCPPPSNLGATAVTASGATLQWQNGCSETLWNIHITAAGGGAPANGNGTNPGITTNPISVTGLKAGVTYEYWVQAHCSINNKSTWAGPYVFTTLVNCATLAGISLTQPIIIGEAPCEAIPFINAQTNTAVNCFIDNYTGANNQTAPDVWYRFTLSSTAIVQISHCNSTFDTYLHLLNSTGTQIAVNDDNGPQCLTTQASIVMSLPAGTYYIVSEGYNTSTGLIITKVNTTTTCPELAGKCYLQGYYDNAGLMRNVLYQQGKEANALSTNVDTLTLELRGASAPYMILHTVKTLLQTNGQFTCSLPVSVLGNSYYVALRHRNSIETWSANPITFAQNTNYDFTDAANKAYGDNQISIGSNLYGLYSGDINQDQTIDALDYILQDEDVILSSSGYLSTDLTGDGVVDLFDYILLDASVIVGYGAILP